MVVFVMVVVEVAVIAVAVVSSSSEVNNICIRQANGLPSTIN